MVNVPDAPKVWVTGNVTHPQAVPVRKPGRRNPAERWYRVWKGSRSTMPRSPIFTGLTRTITGNGTKSRCALKDIAHRKAQNVPLHGGRHFATDSLTTRRVHVAADIVRNARH